MTGFMKEQGSFAGFKLAQSSSSPVNNNCEYRFPPTWYSQRSVQKCDVSIVPAMAIHQYFTRRVVNSGETIHCVSWFIVIQSSNYISWYRKIDEDTYGSCKIYSTITIILRLLLKNLTILNSMYYMHRIVTTVSRYVSYHGYTVSFHS